MQLGIIGLPQSGKTTLFKALTGADIPTEISSGQLEVHTAVVDVPDVRVDQLVELYKPKKIVRAKVTYADIAGLDGSAGLMASLVHSSINWHRWMASYMWCVSSKMPVYRIKLAASIPCAIFKRWIPNLF